MLSFQNKIISIQGLDKIAREIRVQGKRIVLCHGTFDLIHNELIRYFESAKTKGDVLFVGVTSNGHATENMESPVSSDDIRMENLAALQSVDYVFINPSSSGAGAIENLKPHIFVRAKNTDLSTSADDDYAKEQSAMKNCQGEIIITNENPDVSENQTQMHFGLFPEAAQKYLFSFRQKYNYSQIIQQLQDLAKLNVLVR